MAAGSDSRVILLLLLLDDEVKLPLVWDTTSGSSVTSMLLNTALRPDDCPFGMPLIRKVSGLDMLAGEAGAPRPLAIRDSSSATMAAAAGPLQHCLIVRRHTLACSVTPSAVSPNLSPLT